MAKPELRSRRRPLDPEREAQIASFSAAPDTAPKTSPEADASSAPAAPTRTQAQETMPAASSTAEEEPKSKGFNYRMTKSRHAMIDAMRKEDDRSFQWMLDKLIDLGIEAWNDRK
jgi:hypothetical protein